MSSDELPSKSRLRIGASFGTATRELFSIEYKPGQIVGSYNYGSNPKHFTKHADGILHEKADADGSILWERVGMPLAALTGSESLGTYSFLVSDKDALPPLKPRRNDLTMVFPAAEGTRIDLVVVATPRSPPRSMIDEVSARLLQEGMSVHGDASKGLFFGIRQRVTASSGTSTGSATGN